MTNQQPSDPLAEQLDRRRSTVLSRERAFLTILAGAMFADNKERRAEAVELSALIGRIKTLQTIPEQERKEARDEAIADVREESVRKDRVVLACQALVKIQETSAKSDAHLDRLLGESAFAHACDIVCTDHDIHPKEKEFLRTLERELKLDPNRASLIFKTIALKNEN